MKRFIACFLAVVLACLCFSGCNSNDERIISEYESSISALESNVEEKNSKISELEAQNNSLSSDVSSYIAQIDELENSSTRLLSDVLNAFERKDYKKTVELAQQIHSKFNGTLEDEKAQAISEQAQSELDRIAAEAKAAEEREKAEAAKTAADKIHGIIQVHYAKIININSAGGVKVQIAWTNKSPKTIKYITFIAEPYNAVGDRVRCEIKNNDSAWLQVTGPVETGGGSEYYSGYWYGSIWENVWYNSTAKTIKITKIEIEYMDGSKEEIKGENLEYIFW